MRRVYPLDITRVPLSRRGAGIMLFYETDGAAHDAENGLYLSRSTEGVLMGGAEFYRNKNYLLITPVFEGTPVRYTYEATTGGLTITAHEGSIQMVFAGDGSLRVFAEGLGIRLTAKMGFGDVAVSHGKAASAEMDGVTYFMVPTVGSITVDSHYELLTYRYSDPVFEWIPDNGKLEIAVFERAFADEALPPVTGSYAEWETLAAADFDSFCADMLLQAPEAFVPALYSLWIADKPFPGLTGGDAYPSNVIDAVYPRAVEQPILSLAFGNAEEKVRLITKFVPFITKGGLVPEQTLLNKRLYQTVSMAFGYAVLDLLHRCRVSGEQAAQLYDLLATVDNWWCGNRSSDGGVSFFYAYPYESGNKDSSLAAGGCPVTTPDLMTQMILSAEALSSLAGILGHEQASENWKACADKRAGFLMEKLWNGTGFVCLISEQPADCVSVRCFLPLLLTGRLPGNVVRTLADALISESFFVSGRGLREEACGDTVNCELTALLAAGLFDNGCRAEAEQLCEALKELSADHGLSPTVPATGKPYLRCGGSFAPAVSAAVVFAASKVL